MPLNYDKYAELLSPIINGVASDKEREQMKNFEAAQPEKCPHCGARVRSPFEPVRIVHDITSCPRLKQPEPHRPRFGDDA